MQALVRGGMGKSEAVCVQRRVREDRRAFFEHLFEGFPHPALHAYRLGFAHPTTGEGLRFEADPPIEWQRVLDRLRTDDGQTGRR